MEPEGSLPHTQQLATCRSSGDMIQNYSGVLQEMQYKITVVLQEMLYK